MEVYCKIVCNKEFWINEQVLANTARMSAREFINFYTITLRLEDTLPNRDELNDLFFEMVDELFRTPINRKIKKQSLIEWRKINNVPIPKPVENRGRKKKIST